MTAISAEMSFEGALYSPYNEDLLSGNQPIANDLIIGSFQTEDAYTGSTVTVDLYQNFGIKRLLGVKGWRHTTNNSVIVADNPTTTVNNGVATFTVGTGAGKRVYVVVGI